MGHHTSSSRREWGSLTDMPPATSREASKILRRTMIPANVTFVLPYESTADGRRRVWRFGPDPVPRRRRESLRGVAIPVSDLGEPGGAA